MRIYADSFLASSDVITGMINDFSEVTYFGVMTVVPDPKL